MIAGSGSAAVESSLSTSIALFISEAVDAMVDDSDSDNLVMFRKSSSSLLLGGQCYD
jgi:hypothetical protein